MRSAHAVGAAMAGVVLSAAAITTVGPDLVSGSEHEHLPLPGMLVWFWAVIALAHLALLDRSAIGGLALRSVAWTTIGIWTTAAVVAIVGPQLVTGSDPTHVPIAALAAPVFAAFGTSYACLRAAIRREA